MKVSRARWREWLWLVPSGMLLGCPVAVDDRYALEPATAVLGGCSNGVSDGAETDLDCGGPDCAPCAAGAACHQARDCRSTLCVGNQCQPQDCQDGTMNGTETDADCGGPDCPTCAAGLWCTQGPDCSSGTCTDGICG